MQTYELIIARFPLRHPYKSHRKLMLSHNSTIAMTLVTVCTAIENFNKCEFLHGFVLLLGSISPFYTQRRSFFFFTCSNFFVNFEIMCFSLRHLPESAPTVPDCRVFKKELGNVQISAVHVRMLGCAAHSRSYRYQPC